jgi:hypothetical protein
MHELPQRATASEIKDNILQLHPQEQAMGERVEDSSLPLQLQEIVYANAQLNSH